MSKSGHFLLECGFLGAGPGPIYSFTHRSLVLSFAVSGQWSAVNCGSAVLRLRGSVVLFALLGL